MAAQLAAMQIHLWILTGVLGILILETLPATIEIHGITITTKK